jgi:16S rRNA (cytosine967-C5)-methyltransferase
LGRHAGQSERGALADARALAWEILQRVEAEGAYADALLGHRLHESGLAPRDRALATRLVYGTLAWQGYLDHLLAAFSRRLPETLDLPIRTLLRLAMFQICLLTRIPPFAAVNTAVELAKRSRSGAVAGLVNAVLRRAASGWWDVAFPSRDTDLAGFLSTRLAHPRWLVERWLVHYGEVETEALLRANNEPAPTVLRVNSVKVDRAHVIAEWQAGGLRAAPTRYSPVGISLDGAGTAPETLPGHETGWLTAQGEASQLVGFLVGPRPGDRVLDACAAPGGKTTHLAELMGDRGEVVALDIHARGLERLARSAQRLGLSIVRAQIADAMQWRIPTQAFDCVLIDAPCSGLGTLRQHPEVKWRRTPEDIRNLSTLQGQLLHRLSDAVRPGGVLVYSTCTLSRDENEAVLTAFLRERPAFTVDDPRPFLPEDARELVDGEGMLRTFPHRHGLDGFFAARLKRAATRALSPSGSG